MGFPVTGLNTFATATSPIPLSQLDQNFTTVVTAVNGISSGTYPLAQPVIQGGSMSGTITLSGTITGSAGAVNPGTVSTTGSITAGTTISASGTITSGSTVQGTAVTATTGDIKATAGKIIANDPNLFMWLNGGYAIWQVDTAASLSYVRSSQYYEFSGNTGNIFVRLTSAHSYGPETNWVVISDKTLKTDISPLSMSTQRIMSLKPVSFTWIENGDKDSGFIAQDFETVYPENVHEQDGKKHIGIDMNFYADLVATIQELRKELDALKAKVGA
jgi:Chaperone of endosialidase